jgi:hypothetical protein
MTAIYITQSSGNNRAIMPKDTKQDIVLAPADHWQHVLKRKLEDSVGKQKRSLESDFTSVAVSVTQRKEPPLTKVFPKTSIDWAVIERQLVAWGELYCTGKKLRLNFSFNYVEASQSLTTSLGRTDKRGSSSTTGRMLAEGAAQLFGGRYITLCVVLALHVKRVLIASVTLLVKGITP